MGFRKSLAFLIAFVSLGGIGPAIASECKGHIFFYIFEDDSKNEDETDADADFIFYYLKSKNWLPDKGVSYSIHTEFPIKAMTCFGEKETVEKREIKYSLGYIFIRSDFERKVVGGVLTDVDIDSTIKNFFINKNP